jgi:hypothetical protein
VKATAPKPPTVVTLVVSVVLPGMVITSVEPGVMTVVVLPGVTDVPKVVLATARASTSNRFFRPTARVKNVDLCTFSLTSTCVGCEVPLLST